MQPFECFHAIQIEAFMKNLKSLPITLNGSDLYINFAPCLCDFWIIFYHGLQTFVIDGFGFSLGFLN